MALAPWPSCHCSSSMVSIRYERVQTPTEPWFIWAVWQVFMNRPLISSCRGGKRGVGGLLNICNILSATCMATDQSLTLWSDISRLYLSLSFFFEISRAVFPSLIKTKQPNDVQIPLTTKWRQTSNQWRIYGNLGLPCLIPEEGIWDDGFAV